MRTGGCRQLDWDPETQDCKFYEAHLRGSYIGNVAKGADGTPFGDTVGYLEELIDGPDLAAEIRNRWEGESPGSSGGGVLLLDGPDGEGGSGDYQTAFLGVPRVTDDPNFSGGDAGRDDLNDPTNIKTGIQTSESQAKKDRGTITLVGGLLVALFSILFLLMAYVLVKRRRLYRKSHGLPPIGTVCANESEAGMHYADLQKQHNTDHGDDIDGIILGDSADYDGVNYGSSDGGDQRGYHQHHEDEPSSVDGYGYDDDDDDERRSSDNDLATTQAIQMDLGSNLRGQLMGVHGAAAEEHAPPPGNRNGSLLLSPGRGSHEVDSVDLDETDSWAQTDGTIGSLELQLEPITAEV